jgi:acyl carrier protein
MPNEKTNIDVEKDIRELMAEILETEPGEIDAQAQFAKGLGMDSMMALELLAAIEKKYRIVIHEEMLQKFTNLKTTVSIVEGLLKKK